MLSAEIPLVDGTSTQDASPVIDRTSRSISRHVGDESVKTISSIVFLLESDSSRFYCHYHRCDYSRHLNTCFRPSKKRLNLLSNAKISPISHVHSPLQFN